MYYSPSSLFWLDRTIQSAEGVQQGDPLGPLLFCLSIHHIVQQLESELSLFYLDDGPLGGNAGHLERDLEVIEQEGVEIRLHLNKGKSEVICVSTKVPESIVRCLQGAEIVDPSKATILASPIGDVSSVSDALTIKVNQLKKMAERFQPVMTPPPEALLFPTNAATQS